MKTPVLFYTDIGRDVDDLEALTYVAGSPNLEPVAVVTTSMIPEKRGQIARAVLDSLGYEDVPIGIGSVFPMGNEDESQLEKYLSEHTIKGISYEGMGILDEDSNQPSLTADEVISEAIEKYGDKLVVAVLAPATDLAKAIKSDKEKFEKIGGLYIMGQTLEEDGKLVPDPKAYNLAQDMEAAEILFSLQDKVPMTFLTKFAAYATPLNREDFEELEETGNPVGAYLKTHAEKGLECFVRRAPEIFKKVFGVDAEEDAYESFLKLQKLSNPYDALTVMAIDRPELFKPKVIGNHKVIGISADETGIVDEEKTKQELMHTKINALKNSL